MVPTRNDIYRKIEEEVRGIAGRYELEYDIFDDPDINFFERRFVVLFDDPITHAKNRFEVNPIFMNDFNNRVWKWIKEIRGIGNEETVKEPEPPVVEEPIDPLVEIAKQLRIANELKIIELKHGHGTGYFRENVTADIELIEKEMKEGVE